MFDPSTEQMFCLSSISDSIQWAEGVKTSGIFVSGRVQNGQNCTGQKLFYCYGYDEGGGMRRLLKECVLVI